MNTKRILVVDDMIDVRRTAAGMLRDAGHSVEMCGSAAEALSHLRKEYFDVVLLDIRLDDSDDQDISGLNLATEISNLWPKTSIIILTAFATVNMVEQALKPDRAGRQIAVSFLEKTDMGELPRFIENLP